MLFGSKQAVRKPEFGELHLHSGDSVEAQDAYHEYLGEHGLMGASGYCLSDEEAQVKLEAILGLPTTSVEKDALLSALDVDVQNHHSAGMGAVIMNEIHAAQYALLVDEEWKKGCA